LIEIISSLNEIGSSLSKNISTMSENISSLNENDLQLLGFKILIAAKARVK